MSSTLQTGPGALQFETAAQECALTQSSRAQIVRSLHSGAATPLAEEILRAKLEKARSVPAPEPHNLALPGCRVVYMQSGGHAQTVTLTPNPARGPGQASLLSPLGATLVGMQVLQKAPLPTDGDEVLTLVVLRVTPRAARPSAG